MLTLLDGQPGSGKSYTAVNHFLLDVLKLEERPVVLNLPIKREALILEVVRQTKGTKRSPVIRRKVREALERRIIELTPGVDVVRDGQSVIPDAAHAAWMIDWESKWTQTESWASGQAEQIFVFDEKLRPRPGPMVKDKLTEFWYFTPPNAYVIFDEAADQYNNRDRQQNARTTLGEYVRQHRHFKDDLLFITQNFEDLDKQFRSKFELIYRCSNSLKENMFPWKWAQGLKWPLQFFLLRQYLRRGNKLILENTLRVWPKSWGYALYDSFSKPRHNFGKADLKGDERSSDYKPPMWYRVREFITRARDLIFMGIGATVGLVMIGRMMWKMLHTDSNDVAQTLQLEQGAGQAAAGGTNQPGAGSTGTATTSGAGVASAAVTKEGAEKNEQPKEPERPRVVGIVRNWVYFEGGAAKPLEALDGPALAAAVDFLGIWAARTESGLSILWTGGSGAGASASASAAAGQRAERQPVARQ